jgi:multiple sugar transport system permease protein
MIDGLTRLGALLRIVAAAVGAGPGGGGDLHLHRGVERAAAGAGADHVGKRAHAPLALNYLITSDVLAWGPLMAGAVLSSLPLMVLYFVAQRFMVQGMTAGSVKG